MSKRYREAAWIAYEAIHRTARQRGYGHAYANLSTLATAAAELRSDLGDWSEWDAVFRDQWEIVEIEQDMARFVKSV